MGIAWGRTGERAIDAGSEDIDRLEGVKAEEALAESDERGVIEARGE